MLIIASSYCSLLVLSRVISGGAVQDVVICIIKYSVDTARIYSALCLYVYVCICSMEFQLLVSSDWILL